MAISVRSIGVFALLATSILGAPTTTQLYKRSSGTSSSNTGPTPSTPSTTTPTSNLTVGTCISTADQNRATSCPMPTSTPYDSIYFPSTHNSYDADCQMIQLCKNENFQAPCVSVPMFLKQSEGDSCGYLDLKRGCINFPFLGDPDFSEFVQYYGDKLITRSVRSGASVNCTVFTMPDCETWGFGPIHNEPGDGHLTNTFTDPVSSFQCWPKDEDEPTWGIYLTTSSSSSISAATTITVAPSAASSIESALQNDFDPFVDPLLLCQYPDATNCTVRPANFNCISGEGTPALAATGFDFVCEIHAGTSCDGTPVATLQGATPNGYHSATFSQNAGGWSIFCWNAMCTSASDYSSCISTVATPASTITTVLYPIPVTSLSGSSSVTTALPSGANGFPEDPVITPTSTTTQNPQSTPTSPSTTSGASTTTSGGTGDAAGAETTAASTGTTTTEASPPAATT